MFPLPEQKPEPTLKQGSKRFPNASTPKTVILCPEKSFIEEALKNYAYTTYKGNFSHLYLLKNYPHIALAHFGTQAEETASKMEELIEWGVESFISLSLAGALQSKPQVGDIIICERAVRDEKTSGRYLPEAKYIHAPRRMSNRLQAAFKKEGHPFLIGSTWSTDQLDNQQEKAGRYKKQGITAIDFSAAALFAVAHLYQVDLGHLMTICDTSEDLLWNPPLENPKVKEGLHKALQIAIEAAKN